MVGLCVALAMVTCLDRACLATLAPDIMRDVAPSKGQMRAIYSAFVLALAASMFRLGAAWGTCQGIDGSHTGVVSAAMNASGQIGSVFSPLMVTFLLTRLGDWNAPLFIMGGLLLGGTLCWALIDPREKTFD